MTDEKRRFPMDGTRLASVCELRDLAKWSENVPEAWFEGMTTEQVLAFYRDSRDFPYNDVGGKFYPHMRAEISVWDRGCVCSCRPDVRVFVSPDQGDDYVACLACDTMWERKS